MMKWGIKTKRGKAMFWKSFAIGVLLIVVFNFLMWAVVESGGRLL
jgi:hypothetical protein